MNSALRIPYPLWTEVLRDQKRRHAFASERVGFLAAKSTTVEGGALLLLAFKYVPVADEHYIDDPTVGARIDNHAIRSGMQLALDLNASIFHVHQHPHSGRPVPSSTDRREYIKMLPSISNVRPHTPHGALITSFNSASAFVWAPEPGSLEKIKQVSIIGTHIQKFDGEKF